MNGIVDIFLLAIGLVEFIFRAAVILLLAVTFFGLLMVLDCGMSFNDLAVPYLWRIVARSRGFDD